MNSTKLWSDWSKTVAAAEMLPVDSPYAEKLWDVAADLYVDYLAAMREEFAADLRETQADFLAGTGRI